MTVPDLVVYRLVTRKLGDGAFDCRLGRDAFRRALLHAARQLPAAPGRTRRLKSWHAGRDTLETRPFGGGDAATRLSLLCASEDEPGFLALAWRRETREGGAFAPVASDLRDVRHVVRHTWRVAHRVRLVFECRRDARGVVTHGAQVEVDVDAEADRTHVCEATLACLEVLRGAVAARE